MPNKPRDPFSNRPGGVVDRLSTTYQHLLGNKGQQVAGSVHHGEELRDLFAPQPVRENMLETIALSVNLGLTVGNMSEASIRLSSGKYLVSSVESWFPAMLDQDLILVSQNLEKGFNHGQSPNHWAWHLFAYHHYPDDHAVFLGQPAAALAVSARGELPDSRLLAGTGDLGGFMLSSPDATEIEAAIQQAQVVLITGVGLLSHSSTLHRTISNMQTVNRLCEITVMADNKH
jgi:ribulose-5-phosphate 4-epimerase/fuculose-1-phosphate aldolase